MSVISEETRSFDSHVSIFVFFLGSNESAIFVITRHGGHLGFFEGGLLAVNPITWLDKALIQYTTAVMQANRSEDLSPLDKQIGNFVIASWRREFTCMAH